LPAEWLLAIFGNFRYGVSDMKRRRSYTMHLVVNGRSIEEVVTDPHYEVKHSEIDDEPICFRR
jgi:hypothetical protein